MKEQEFTPVSKYSQVTDGICITVRPTALVDESNPALEQFIFAYYINIINQGDRAVQLLERHWLVYSAEHLIAEVVGPGVVGEQPVIAPGGSYSYASSTVINDPVGAMEGSYTMRYVAAAKDFTASRSVPTGQGGGAAEAGGIRPTRRVRPAKGELRSRLRGAVQVSAGQVSAGQFGQTPEVGIDRRLSSSGQYLSVVIPRFGLVFPYSYH